MKIPRIAWLLVCAAALGAATFFTRDDAVVAAADVGEKRGSSRHSSSNAKTPEPVRDESRIAISNLRRMSDEVLHNPFAPLSTREPAASAAAAPAKPQIAKPSAPPPAPPPAAAPAPPAAPPLTMTSLGSISGPQVAGGSPVAFIQQQGQVHVVKVGDVFAPHYRVEAITPERIELVHLPSMQRQSLPLAKQ